MAKPQDLSTLDVDDLTGVVGGRGRGFIEGLRHLYNAGVVALQVLNPSTKPPPRIPNPPRIERPAPVLPGPRRSPGGPDPQPPSGG
jgi:hypothetical protein